MNYLSFIVMLFALVATIHASPLGLFMSSKRITEAASCIEAGSNDGQLAAVALQCDNVLHRRGAPSWKRSHDGCPEGDLKETYDKFFNLAFNQEFERRYKECSALPTGA